MDAVLKDVCNSILETYPENFDEVSANLAYPVKYSESMNTVLT